MGENQRLVKKMYWEYLMSRVGEHKDYTLLLRQLYTTPFRWPLHKDHNRAYESDEIRRYFGNDMDINYDEIDGWNDQNVSFLEVLLQLATRCETGVGAMETIQHTVWFWKFMDHLGLDKYNNYTYDSEKVEEIVEKCIERRYDRLGNGGLFPLKASPNDQRLVELWYQMAEYLHENYYYKLFKK